MYSKKIPKPTDKDFKLNLEELYQVYAMMGLEDTKPASYIRLAIHYQNESKTK